MPSFVVNIDPVVLEKKIKMWKVYRQTDNRRSEKLRWAKNQWNFLIIPAWSKFDIISSFFLPDHEASQRYGPAEFQTKCLQKSCWLHPPDFGCVTLPKVWVWPCSCNPGLFHTELLWLYSHNTWATDVNCGPWKCSEWYFSALPNPV